MIKLLTGHQASLRAFIISLMPGSPDVQDVLQDTNIVIWEKMNQFESGSNFKAWAFSIARNNVMAHLRSVKRSQSPALNENVIQAICDAWYQRPQNTTDMRQLALEHCLNKLSNRERRLVESRYASHLSIKEHAASIGRSAETLRVTLFRIREKLRKCVNARIKMSGGTA